MRTDQDVRLTVCMGQPRLIPTNNPFRDQIGPYLDFVVVRLETEGVRPQVFTISQIQNLPSSFTTLPRLVHTQGGVADMGLVKLDQIVDLGASIQGKPLAAAEPLPTIPAGSAYGADK